MIAPHCVDDIFRSPKGFESYALASQADPLIYGHKVKILSTWRNNGGEKIYVASNAPEVELVVNGKSLGRAEGGRSGNPTVPLPPLWLTSRTPLVRVEKCFLPTSF